MLYDLNILVMEGPYPVLDLRKYIETWKLPGEAHSLFHHVVFTLTQVLERGELGDKSQVD